MLPSLLKTLTALTSILAPAGSPPPAPAVPVLLLTLQLATVDFSALGLVLVTLLSCVSAGGADTPAFAAGILPSLCRTLTLAGGIFGEEEEEEVGGSDGGRLNFPPRRRSVTGAAFVVGLFFSCGGGLLRMPAYCRTEPSPSLSSSSSSTFTATLPGVGASSPLSALSRRLNTPVGC